MGTLFNQPIRPKYNITILGRSRHIERTENSSQDETLSLEEIYLDFIEFKKKHAIEFEEFIALYNAAVNHRNSLLKSDNGDRFDEQMSGFGELFEQLILAIIGKNK